MEFRLNCRMNFSKTLKDIKFDEIIENSKTLLQKGAPEGRGAVIERFFVEGDNLDLVISSGTYVRPHDAVFRLKNHFSKELGKKHHVGVRSIKAVEYAVSFELDNPPKEGVSVPFAENLSFEGKKCRLVLKDVGEEFLQKNYVDRMINLIKEKVRQQQFGVREEHHEVIYTGKEHKTYYNQNPSEELLKRNWIKRTPHRNQFIIGPQVTELYEGLKRAYVDVVYKSLGFVEMIFPKIVTWDTWKKSGHVNGLYYSGFTPYLFTTPKSAAPEEWENITDIIKITGEIPFEKLAEKLEPPRGGLAFAQCPPFWHYIEGETIASESLPIKVFDWSGPTYRYESGGAHGFERVDELHRIETLWVGTKEQTIETAAKVKERLRVLMEDVFELQMREAWVTPWFMEQSGLTKLADEERMIVGTTDLEAYLPYDGRWLEVQNCSNNGDKYPNGFNVKSQKEELWSGCAGGSLERYMSAFLAQKGFDEDKWPKSFKKYLNKLPDGIVFM